MDIDVSKLKGRHVSLELLTEDHREIIRPIAKDERIWELNRMLLIDETYDSQFDSYFAFAMDPMGRGEQHTFVIHKTGEKEIIGMTRFYELSERHKRVAIGYTWYIPSVWRKVHNKECKLLLLQYAFEELGFNRVEFTVASQNIRSQKAVEKIGAVKEGVMRKHSYRNDGSQSDTILFSIINDEWPVNKEKLKQLITESEND
ncbi:MAG: GNAT family N-acetyltransferase [Chitinophagales bacterium]